MVMGRVEAIHSFIHLLIILSLVLSHIQKSFRKFIYCGSTHWTPALYQAALSMDRISKSLTSWQSWKNLDG